MRCSGYLVMDDTSCQHKQSQGLRARQDHIHKYDPCALRHRACRCRGETGNPPPCISAAKSVILVRCCQGDTDVSNDLPVHALFNGFPGELPALSGC